MNWVFIVSRDNTIERVRIFADYWVGCAFADNFIRSIDSSMTDMPAYHKGESYTKDDLSVGLYREESV